MKASLSKSITLPTNSKFLLAFSGGSDSLLLLYLLSLYAKDRTIALYVNHRLRGEEELNKEIELNRKNALSLGIPFAVYSLERNEVEKYSKEKNIGLEAAARELRYKALNEYACYSGCNYILTAHHREDQVETVLMRMLDSSPFWTYGGILKENKNIYRPILEWSKKNILEVLKEKNLSWSEDSTNNDLKLRRNFVRQKILPKLSESEKETISGIASNLSFIRNKHESIPIVKNYYKKMERQLFFKGDSWAKEEAVYALLYSKGRVPRTFVDDVLKKIEKGEGRISYGSTWIFITQNIVTSFLLEKEFCKPLVSLPVKLTENLSLRNMVEDENTLKVDFSSLKFPVVVRTSREGDEIKLKEGRKKISDLERSLKIPFSVVLEDRDGIVAFFSRFLGGKDRLCKRLLNKNGTPLATIASQ